MIFLDTAMTGDLTSSRAARKKMFVFKLFLTIILSSSSDKDDGFGEDANVVLQFMSECLRAWRY
ncbi:hypothetical protein N027_14825 [Pseudomonas syringae USA007]|uniref:Uncharacterized protein n=1 Tax=Pseudomonas syringae USA007 TaxID=1357288 RepID=A0AAU8M417_PSESX|nr:hypothetical protein [Pseudomonas syringae]